jgi:hypothetical protein
VLAAVKIQPPARFRIPPAFIASHIR